MRHERERRERSETEREKHLVHGDRQVFDDDVRAVICSLRQNQQFCTKTSTKTTAETQTAKHTENKNRKMKSEQTFVVAEISLDAVLGVFAALFRARFASPRCVLAQRQTRQTVRDRVRVSVPVCERMRVRA